MYKKEVQIPATFEVGVWLSVEPLPSMCRALGSISSEAGEKEKRLRYLSHNHFLVTLNTAFNPDLIEVTQITQEGIIKCTADYGCSSFDSIMQPP